MAALAGAFVRSARAKFNLRLEVGERACNGLHRIRSAVTDLLVCDELSFLPSSGRFSVTCDDTSIPESSNLASIAANALGAALPPVRIHVRKRLPIQAGLGGGSADAATALRGIAEVLAATGITIADGALFAAAATAGSDVSACLVAGLKAVGGTGEIVRPFPSAAPPWGVLLLKPEIGVRAAEAYRLFDEARIAPRTPSVNRHDASSHVDEICHAYAGADLARVSALMHNDLQEPVESAFPAIGDARRRIAASGAAVTMLCGSGSCVAGLFDSVAAAEAALSSLRVLPTEWAHATGFSDGT